MENLKSKMVEEKHKRTIIKVLYSIVFFVIFSGLFTIGFCLSEHIRLESLNWYVTGLVIGSIILSSGIAGCIQVSIFKLDLYKNHFIFNWKVDR